MASSGNPQPNAPEPARPPWWIWIAATAALAIIGQPAWLFRIAPGVSLLMLFVPAALVFTYWLGPRMLPGVFLASLLCAPAAGLPWAIAPVVALADAAFAGLSWFIFQGLARGRCWLPVRRDLLLLLGPGILFPLLIREFVIQLCLLFTEKADTDLFSWATTRGMGLGALMSIAVAVPALHFLTERVHRRGWTMLDAKPSPAPPLLPASRRNGRDIALLVVTFIAACVPNWFTGMQWTWFTHGVFMLTVALYFGMSATTLAVAWSIFLAMLVPAAAAGEFSRLWHVENQSTAVIFDLLVACAAAMLVGRSVSDSAEEIDLRRRAEQTVRRIEQRLRTTIANTPAAVAMFDRNMRYIAYSKRWLTDYHLGDQNLLGRSHYDVFPEINDEWKQIHRHSLSGVIQRREEDRFVRADGRVDWVRWEIHPWNDENDQIGGIVMFTEVITEQKAAREATRISEERYRVVSELVSDYVFSLRVDEAGNFTREWITDAMERITGYTLEQLDAQGGYRSIVLPEDQARVDEQSRRWRAGIADVSEERVRTRSGDVRWLRIYGRPIFDESRRVVRVIAAGQDITDRKRSEDALRESEHRFRSIAETTPAPVLISRRDDGLILYANPDAARAFGVPTDRLIGQRTGTYYADPADRQRLIDAMKATGSIRGFELQVLRPDGRRLWVSVSIESVTFRGEPVYFTALFDITGRKEMEEELKQSHGRLVEWKSRYDAAIAATHQLLYDWNSRTNNIVWGGTIEQTLGYQPEEIQNTLDWWIERIHADDREMFLSEMKCAVNDQSSVDVEYRVQRKDGSYITVIDRGSFFTDARGNVERMVGFVINVSEHRRTEQALRESEARFRQLAENINEVFWLIDTMTGQLIYASPAFESLFGTSVGAVVVDRDAWVRVVHRDDREAFIAAHHAADGRAFDIEFRVVTPDSAERWVRARGFPVQDAMGKTYRLAGVAEDITARKHSEELLRRQQILVQAELTKVKDELVRHTRLATIGQVAASIAHDLRNPLGAIRNAGYYLKRHVPDDQAKWREYLEIIEHEVLSADQIISNLMDMVRAKHPTKQLVDLRDAVGEAFSRIINAEDVTLDMSTVPRGLTIHADKNQFQQVLRNLLDNAVQAMEARGRVMVHAADDGVFDTIEISNDGPGIPEHLQDRVFEPLFTTRAKGTGLGLAICRQLIERHGGRIDLISGGNRGVCFVIRLPKRQEPEQP